VKILLAPANTRLAIQHCLDAPLRLMTKAAASDAAVSEDRLFARVLVTWLDCSRSYVTELEDTAVLKRVGGKLPLRASVAAYVRFLRQQRDQDQSPRSEAAAEHHRLKAQLLAYQIAKHEREHITIDAHNHFVDTVMGLYLSSLAQLPATMGGNDLTTRRK
jgi:hypothetical protein